MNYEETLTYIHQTPKFSRVLGNTVLKKLLYQLGNPQMGQKYIHVGGTNGKGSVVAMTAHILNHAGYKTGIFTSPYLERFNERISINGTPISDDDLARLATKVRLCMEKNQIFVSEFALDLTIAFLYFAEQNCDFILLEVGMGGRLDATNVIKASAVTALTSIGRDHMQYLGESLAEITREKCGIIKPNGIVVVAPEQSNIVLEEIKIACTEQNSAMVLADLSVAEPFTLGLKGSFQRKNAAVAIEICRQLRTQGWDITRQNIASGLSAARWPGRFEKIRDHLILDGAHNLPAAKELATELSSLGEKIHLITAMMKDKEVEEVVRILSQTANKVTVTEVDMPRCYPAEDLKKLFISNGCETNIIKPSITAVQEAIEDNSHLVCVCGSLYLGSEIREQLSNI